MESDSPSTDSAFEHPIGEFADDDNLMVSPTEQEILSSMATGANYLERDDFESELGAVDALAEDFVDVASLDIVDVVGDDRAGRPLVVVYACRFPNNKIFDHAKFLRYLTHILDKFVDQDYTVLYFHYGLRSHNKPPLRWLRQMYQLLDRRYKKNLKALYLVHPTKFIKAVWLFCRPWISAKFERKLHYVNFIGELDEFVHAEQLQLPVAIKEYVAPRSALTFRHDAALLNKKRSPDSSDAIAVNAAAQFGVTLEFIMQQHVGHELPPVLDDLLTYLRATSLDVEGIFRRSANLALLRQVQARINNGEIVNFHEFNDTHLAAALLKTFLRELRHPLIPFDLYPVIVQANQNKAEAVVKARQVVDDLPAYNRRALRAVILFLTEVVKHSEANLMTANNVSVVFGPNLTWPDDQQLSLGHLRELNMFAYTLITQYAHVFE